MEGEVVRRPPQPPGLFLCGKSRHHLLPRTRQEYSRFLSYRCVRRSHEVLIQGGWSTRSRKSGARLSKRHYSPFVRIKAAFSGHEGEFLECYELDTKLRRKIPRRMQGRILSQSKAAHLLGNLA
jgi:hypothetical protein